MNPNSKNAERRSIERIYGLSSLEKTLTEVLEFELSRILEELKDWLNRIVQEQER